MGKYGKYKKRYNSEWEKELEFKNWLTANEDDGARCKVCHSNLRAHRTDLIKHTKTKIHMENMKKIIPPKNQMSLNSCGIISQVSVSKEIKSKELILAAYIAMHSSIRSIDHLGDCLNKLNLSLPDKTASSLRMHRTKCTALIKNVISPVLQVKLVEDMKDSYFSLILDESTDVSVCKYLCMCVRYYSESRSSMVTEYLGIVEVGRTRAEDLYEAVKNYVTQIGLNYLKIIGIGTDGAANMCGNEKSLYALLKKDIPELQLVKCICHSIHLCSEKAFKELPCSLEFLVRETYNWFSHSPLRKLNYQIIFNLINTENLDKKPLKIIQASPTRWLSRYLCIERLVTQWLELKTHFEISAVNEKCYTARQLTEMYRDKTNYLYLIFLKPVLKELNSANLLFQNTNVDVDIIYENLKTLIISIFNRIIKPNFKTYFNNKENCDNKYIKNTLMNDLAYTDLKNVDYGLIFTTELNNSNLPNDKVVELRMRCFNFLKILCITLCEKLPDNMNLLKKFILFQPNKCLNQLTNEFKNLPLKYFEGDLNEMENMWRNVVSVDWKLHFLNSEIPNDTITFWGYLLNFQDAGKNFPFKKLAQNILKLLTFPVSNAVVERVFSVMNCIKTKQRNRMNLTLLDSLLRIKTYFYSRNSCCVNFSPCPIMLNKFTSDMYLSVSVHNNNNQTETDVNETWEFVDASI